jgi:hypothetical protein
VEKGGASKPYSLVVVEGLVAMAILVDTSESPSFQTVLDGSNLW